jgi:hypothetical protein
VEVFIEHIGVPLIDVDHETDRDEGCKHECPGIQSRDPRRQP